LTAQRPAEEAGVDDVIQDPVGNVATHAFGAVCR
jgi:hypothetical protein